MWLWWWAGPFAAPVEPRRSCDVSISIRANEEPPRLRHSRGCLTSSPRMARGRGLKAAWGKIHDILYAFARLVVITGPRKSKVGVRRPAPALQALARMPRRGERGWKPRNRPIIGIGIRQAVSCTIAPGSSGADRLPTPWRTPRFRHLAVISTRRPRDGTRSRCGERRR